MGIEGPHPEQQANWGQLCNVPSEVPSLQEEGDLQKCRLIIHVILVNAQILGTLLRMSAALQDQVAAHVLTESGSRVSAALLPSPPHAGAS